MMISPGHVSKSMDRNIPGPGSYNHSVIRDDGAKAILSNKISIRNIRFGQSKRNWIDLKNQTPGPGQYRLPSDFGYYKSKVAINDN